MAMARDVVVAIPEGQRQPAGFTKPKATSVKKVLLLFQKKRLRFVLF